MPRNTRRRRPRTITRSPNVVLNTTTITQPKLRLDMRSLDEYEIITDENDVPLTDEHGLTLVE